MLPGCDLPLHLARGEVEDLHAVPILGARSWLPRPAVLAGKALMPFSCIASISSAFCGVASGQGVKRGFWRR